VAEQQQGVAPKSTMTPTELLQLIENAPQMDGQQYGLALRALDAYESNARDEAGLYLESMSKDGLARFLYLLKKMGPLAQSKLMQK
jgi:hypothetical protein